MKVTADDIAQLLASSPPRRVPAHLEKAAQGGNGVWWAAAFGLFFGGFGMIFVVVFFPWRIVDELRLGASRETAPGEIAHAAPTNLKMNHARVWEYAFAFTAPNGDRQEGRCYAAGRRWREGARVTVRYLRDHPHIARVDGARLSKGSWFGAFTLIFPLVGFGIVAGAVRARRETTRLLREGQMAEVDIVSVDETRLQENYKTVYRITFSNPTPGGPPITIRRAERAAVDLALKHWRDRQPVFVLHDPRKSTRVIFPEALINQ